MSDYQPVSCDMHSRLELLAMHKTRVLLTIIESEHLLKGIIQDIRIHDGAEYLLLTDGREVRLDTIVSVEAAE